MCFLVSLQYWIILQFVFSLLSKIEIRWILIIHILCVKSIAISLTLLQYKMHPQCIHQHTVWDWGPICQTKLKFIQIIDWPFIQKKLVNFNGINIFIESFELKFDEFDLMNSLWLRGKWCMKYAENVNLFVTQFWKYYLNLLVLWISGSFLAFVP